MNCLVFIMTAIKGSFVWMIFNVSLIIAHNALAINCTLPVNSTTEDDEDDKNNTESSVVVVGGVVGVLTIVVVIAILCVLLLVW